MNREFKCSKCQCTDILVTYQAIKDRTVRPHQVRAERLACECNRCGFLWNEPCGSPEDPYGDGRDQ